MAIAPPQQRQARSPQPAAASPQLTGRIFQLSDVTKTSKVSPSRYALYANGGFGKSSFAAYTPKPIFLMTKGETGLLTLIQSGELPETPHLPELQNWTDLKAAVRFLRTAEHDFKTLCLDTVNGAERMLHEEVCDVTYGGDWDSKDYGFLAWGGKGYDTALGPWRELLNELDKLRDERGMTIFFLSHAKIQTFKNPSGADFDRWVPEMHPKTWSVTKGWLDCTLFGNFEVVVRSGKKETDAGRKGKAADVAARILYTNSDNPTYDAKNRFGLPAEIEMGDSPKQAWDNFTTALKESRKVAQ